LFNRAIREFRCKVESTRNRSLFQPRSAMTLTEANESHEPSGGLLAGGHPLPSLRPHKNRNCISRSAVMDETSPPCLSNDLLLRISCPPLSAPQNQRHAMRFPGAAQRRI